MHAFATSIHHRDRSASVAIAMWRDSLETLRRRDKLGRVSGVHGRVRSDLMVCIDVLIESDSSANQTAHTHLSSAFIQLPGSGSVSGFVMRLDADFTK